MKFLTSFIIIFIFLILVLLISWHVHLSMTIEYCKRKNCGWGSYDEFIEQFKICELQKYEEKTFSFRNNINNSQFSNSIIKFKGKGMLLYPIAWLRVNLYIKNLTKKHKIGKFKDL